MSTPMLDSIDRELGLLARRQPDIARLLSEPARLPDPEPEPGAADPEPGGPALEPESAGPELDDEDDDQEPDQRALRPMWALLGLSVVGAALVGTIGFAGSYDAVRQLGIDHGVPRHIADLLPIGVDSGIIVFLALALALAWAGYPVWFLRPAAHALTFATIAFNAAGSWQKGDPVGVGLHAVLPILFVAAVEAAYSAVSRMVGIETGERADTPRGARWLLAPLPTFLLWRRMVLWDLRSYRSAVKLERSRVTFKMLVVERYGRGRKVPAQARLRLRLAKLGAALEDPLPDVSAIIEQPSANDSSTTTKAAGHPSAKTSANGDATRAAGGGLAETTSGGGTRSDKAGKAGSALRRTSSTNGGERPSATARIPRAASRGRLRRPSLTDDQLDAALKDLDPGSATVSVARACREVGCSEDRAKQALARIGRLPEGVTV
ncbi:DUF2637 domain-containing protein [Streptomyces sp. NRRL S-87]|uniref:DUF2637 domain-containing protein n=1 Tax=Streptomyces sp. NRRL S-87 TaxID=1463920 RepID=UPI0006918285|nr:DUF2637 domain-containing protein [Streptomyces sp. NRRL S-87]